MDINDFPQWVIDVQSQAHNMMYGKIPMELVVSGNKIAKINVTKAHETKFRNNEEAKIYALDKLNSSSPGTTVFSVVKNKDGKISQINTFETTEHNIPL